MVKTLVDSYGKDKLQTIEFPKYAPEQNPQEHVLKELRKHITHNKFISSHHHPPQNRQNPCKEAYFWYN